jgi:hypothetical protein
MQPSGALGMLPRSIKWRFAALLRIHEPSLASTDTCSRPRAPQWSTRSLAVVDQARSDTIHRVPGRPKLKTPYLIPVSSMVNSNTRAEPAKSPWKYHRNSSRKRNAPAALALPKLSVLALGYSPRRTLMLASAGSAARFASRARWPN